MTARAPFVPDEMDRRKVDDITNGRIADADKTTPFWLKNAGDLKAIRDVVLNASISWR